jgi:hypothetical protein
VNVAFRTTRCLHADRSFEERSYQVVVSPAGANRFEDVLQGTWSRRGEVVTATLEDGRRFEWTVGPSDEGLLLDGATWPRFEGDPAE